MDMKKCKTKSVHLCRILELPLLVLYNILARLTVETILSCKCVCKTFLEILTDPYFAKLHFIEALKVEDFLIIPDQKCISKFLLVYNNKPTLEKMGSYYDSRPCPTLTLPAIVSHLYNLVHVVASCNGIICLRFRNENPCHSIYYIINPVLGEFSVLPPNVKSPIPYMEHSGFGFCPKTNQYKIIGFINYSFCSIYTLGTRSWRKLRHNVPFPEDSIAISGCSLNGNLHWTTANDPMNHICSFNLESEQFSYISSPAQFDHNALTHRNYSKIGLLDGLLCFSYSLNDRFEVFVMKDYGAKDRCWTKELTIDLRTISILQDMISFVVDFLDNGDLYLCITHDRSKVIAYNIRTGTIRYKLAKDCRTYRYNVKSFVPSLISLKDI